jgi:hypothetical protein
VLSPFAAVILSDFTKAGIEARVFKARYDALRFFKKFPKFGLRHVVALFPHGLQLKYDP